MPILEYEADQTVTESSSWDKLVSSVTERLVELPAVGTEWAVLSGDGKHRVIDLELTDAGVSALLIELVLDKSTKFKIDEYLYHGIPIGVTIKVQVGSKSKSSQSTYFMIAPNKWPEDIETRISFTRACEKGAANLGGQRPTI